MKSVFARGSSRHFFFSAWSHVMEIATSDSLLNRPWASVTSEEYSGHPHISKRSSILKPSLILLPKSNRKAMHCGGLVSCMSGSLDLPGPFVWDSRVAISSFSRRNQSSHCRLRMVSRVGNDTKGGIKVARPAPTIIQASSSLRHRVRCVRLALIRPLYTATFLRTSWSTLPPAGSEGPLLSTVESFRSGFWSGLRLWPDDDFEKDLGSTSSHRKLSTPRVGHGGSQVLHPHCSFRPGRVPKIYCS